MSENAPVVYGKYQLLDLLARGGMAEVFKAKSHGVEGFEKILVIKRILPELSRNPQFVEMFINEAKIAVTLSHANIVQVFDLGRADETYFIAMEYVAGYDLATILRRSAKYKRPLSQELAVFVVSELAKGLDYAHRRRDASLRPLHIVHRDVSPQNVLISFEGEVKLTDFGIAKAKTIVGDDTDHGVLKGKYAYMSPEQARGDDVDARTDLYALGIVLFEALSGKNPFHTSSSYETLRRVRDGDSPPLKSVMADVPDELAAIVDQALRPTAGERHPNAGRLYEELVQFLYSSGRRVGGHDLARYLQDLREASQAGEAERDAARLRAVFDEEGSQGAYSPEATPVEVPFSRSARQSPGSSEGGQRRAPTGVARPTQERRDVTALVVQSPSPSFLANAVIDQLTRRFGGIRLDEAPRVGGMPEIVLLFGVRDPDGRDTQSAARCALRIARAAATGTQTGQPEVPVQLAVHCGRILVDLSGEAIRDESFDRLLDAARALASRSARSQILLSPAAQRIVAGLFITLPHGDGDDPPFVLEEERDLPDASGKFIGRRDELRQMGEILALANRGKLKMLGLSGEAGVGKTRLMLETRRRLKLGGHDVGMHIATCSRQGRTVPLAGITEMVRSVLGIDEFDPDDELEVKIGRLRELGLGQQDVAAIGAALGIGVLPEGADSLVRVLRPALGRIALKLAQDRLTVFAFDGAESLDDESQMLIDGLVRDGRDARIAIVLSYRPGFVHGWTGLATYHELAVGPMSDDDVARLTATRLAAEEVPLELLREVTAKSAGNPLYVEEYLKALSDAGAVDVIEGRVTYRPEVAEVEVPKTLRGIVGARLGRLGMTDRHLLQIAAVATARFTAELLAEVSGEEVSAVVEALSVLEGRGLVVRAGAGASELTFAHELVGEVLREGLTLETRREIHGAVAQALEMLYPQRVDELAERLAGHWREAGDRAKAIEYLVRAGERMAAEHAMDGAVQSLERSIDLLSQMAVPDRERMLTLYRRIGEICWKGRKLEPGAERMTKAVELADALGRDDWVARLSLLKGRLLVAAHRVDEGRRWLDRAGDIARKLDDKVLFRDIVLATAESCMRLGDHRGGIHFFEQALSLSREATDGEAQVRCLVPLALAYSTSGNRTAALRALADARALTGSSIDRFTECELLKMESLAHFYARDYPQAIDVAARALELAKEYGFTYEAAVNAHNVGEAHLRSGDYKRAFASLRYSYELARDHGFEGLMMGNMRILGFIDAMRFDSDEGRQHVVDANDFADVRGLVWDLIQGRYYLAMVDQARGDVEDARAALREVLRLAAEHGHADYLHAAEKALEELEAGRSIPMPD